MSKVQTRKSLSLSRATYDAATAAAAREGIATSEWVTRLIRKACPELPEQLHASTPEGRSATAGQSRKKKRTGAEIIEMARALSVMSAEDVEAMLAANGRRETKPLNLITGDRFDRGDEACAHTVAAATPEPPPTRADLDRMAAERKRTVKPGTFCANCIERRATHRGRIDLSGAIYDLCDECELPAHEVDGVRGYHPPGGLPSKKEVDAGARRAMGDAEYERTAEIERKAGLAPSAPLDEAELFDRQRYIDGVRRARTDASRIRSRASGRERKVW